MPAAEMVLSELPDFPHVPELPARGPWFDMVGRGCAVLLDLPVAHAAGRWSFARGGRGIGTDLRKARSGLRDDSEQFADLVNQRQVLGAHDGEESLVAVKMQFCGPITLAASVELPNGQPALSDARARADIAASFAEGIRQHVLEIAGWFPEGLPLVVQIDEPAVAAALQGDVPTVSGIGNHAPVASDEVEAQLAHVVRSVAGPAREVVVHCCAQDPPVRILGAAGAQALSVDLTMLDVTSRSADHLSEWLQEGNKLLAGVSVSDSIASVAAMMGEDWLMTHGSKQLTLTPPCGLADTAFDNAALDKAASQYRRLRTMQRDFVAGILP